MILISFKNTKFKNAIFNEFLAILHKSLFIENEIWISIKHERELIQIDFERLLQGKKIIQFIQDFNNGFFYFVIFFYIKRLLKIWELYAEKIAWAKLCLIGPF